MEGDAQVLKQAVVVELRPTPKFEAVLTVAEAAAASKHSASYLYRAVSEGKLPAIRHGRSIRIRVVDYERWMQPVE